MNTTDSTSDLQLTHNVSQDLVDKILDLQYALQKELPTYESLLHTIHRNLANDPDTVHLLTDEQIGIIVAGLSKKTGVAITKELVAKKVKGPKNVTTADI